MQNQILRNNLGEKIQSQTNTRIGIGFGLFFILTVLIFSIVSFIGGYTLKEYLSENHTKISSAQKNSESKNIEKPKEYEISLGSFHDKTDAEDLLNKLNELELMIEKTKHGYTIKLKDKFDFQEAISISQTIKSEYKIISTVIERDQK